LDYFPIYPLENCEEEREFFDDVLCAIDVYAITNVEGVLQPGVR